jgi:hypothetical protein
MGCSLAEDTTGGRSSHATTSFRFSPRVDNEVIIVVDCLRSDEPAGRNSFNSLRDLVDYEHQRYTVERVEAGNADAFRTFLSDLRQRCVNDRLRPILHVECHGNPVKGMQIGDAGDWLRWPTLEELLRPVNAAADGQLGVVMAVCHGLHVLASIKIHRPAPFAFVLGSQDILLEGQIRSQLPAFYRTLFETRDFDRASARVPACKPFHAERMLAHAVTGYFRASVGKAGQQRVERLVTEAQANTSGYVNRQQLRAVRKDAKRFVKSSVSAATLEKYAVKFLAGRRASFSFEDLLTWMKS